MTATGKVVICRSLCHNLEMWVLGRHRILGPRKILGPFWVMDLHRVLSSDRVMGLPRALRRLRVLGSPRVLGPLSSQDPGSRFSSTLFINKERSTQTLVP